MKKRWLIACTAILLLVILACCSGMGKGGPAAPSETPAAAPENGETAPEQTEAALPFTTTAFDGTEVDESILSGASVNMVNFFEPWCPPCIAELPELQKLYETYADRGFNLIGVYSTEEGTASVLDEAGIGYHVLRYTEAFDVFQTGYVPTTVFLDAFGKQIGETVVGARSYEQWEEIVKELLG